MLGRGEIASNFPAHPTVPVHAAGWLTEGLQSWFCTAQCLGHGKETLRRGRCSCLAPTASPSHHPRRLLLLRCPASITFAVAASALLPFTTHSWADYRLHAPYRCSSLTASRSFRCCRNSLSLYLRTSILRRSKHPPPKLLRGNVNKRWSKHPRLDITEHGTIRPLRDHNDTHDEAFGYSGRNWHGHTPSVPTLRRKAWP